MDFKIKCENKGHKYKAIYKSLYSGNTKELNVIAPTQALSGFLEEDNDIWEVYMLVSVMPLDKIE